MVATILYAGDGPTLNLRSGKMDSPESMAVKDEPADMPPFSGFTLNENGWLLAPTDRGDTSALTAYCGSQPCKDTTSEWRTYCQLCTFS